MKSKKQKRIEESINYLLQLKNGLLEEAALYKKKHQDWDKLPDPSSLKTIYLIFPLTIDVKEIAETAFCRVEVIRADKWSMTCKYSFRQKPSIFSSEQSFEFKVEVKTNDFNKNWFVSKEIATEEVIRRIESGERFDANLYDFVPKGILNQLSIGKSH